MYSGNHSPCHPLDTILEAAKQLAGDREIVFVFAGGGSRFAQVKHFGREHNLPNLVCTALPADGPACGKPVCCGSARGGDGRPLCGSSSIPAKFITSLRIGSPLLYIGFPDRGHVTEIIETLNGEPACAWASHGEVDRVRGAYSGSEEAKRNPPRSAQRGADGAIFQGSVTAPTGGGHWKWRPVLKFNRV